MIAVQRQIFSLILFVIFMVPNSATALRAISPCHVTNAPDNGGILLAEFTTHFKETNVRRAANVRLAASKLDGVVIPARENLSYNEVVGPRTAETGFHPALVIDQGKYVERPGGGVCQPSSTLYAASLFSGLRAVERSNHSWQSPYIGPGLDAAVVWNHKDLVLRNPYSFAVRIHATVAADHITVRVIAERRPMVFYDVQTEIQRTVHFDLFETDAPKLSVGKRLLTARGIDGLRLSRKRISRTRAGVKRVERLSADIYFPRHERYLVGTYMAKAAPKFLAEREPGLKAEQPKQTQ